MLTPELAEKIISEVRKYLNEDIIVVNTNGIIIASTDINRIGNFHEGAKIAAQNGKKLTINQKKQEQLQGVKPGINLPVFFQKKVIGVIGITGTPAKVSPFGEIIRKMTELLISENHFAEQSDWHSRAIEGFVFDWLQEKDWDSSFTERAKLLNINLEVSRQMVIAKFKQDNKYINREIWTQLYSWGKKTEQDFIFRWGNDRIVLLLEVSGSPKELRDKINQFHDFLKYTFGTAISAGAGKAVSPFQLVASYRQAERALQVAKNEEKLVFDEDLTLEMILDDLSPETKSEFVDRTIGPLLPDSELTDTLKELFKQNHSLKKTAEALHIHINTLHYRLKKIKDITDFSTANINDLFILFLALIILDEK
ncbi:sugar diacid recognition domain-containing protein [Bacillus sp. B15-48]|uniref:CdaR family transcriptional regulator n=1 Tax=Bacillus sp. B15-48 TaxID=1548601 RepID=UPI00193F781D|nr:sugar diacid recognition domain-containing protein [Bacillus sp. B15-48]MBM4761023.1 carbohydrate diacid regulator [Bacillus sp. B15-48]